MWKIAVYPEIVQEFQSQWNADLHDSHVLLCGTVLVEMHSLDISAQGTGGRGMTSSCALNYMMM